MIADLSLERDIEKQQHKLRNIKLVDLLIQHKQETIQDLISCITIINIQRQHPTKEEVEEKACPQQLAEEGEETSLMKIKHHHQSKRLK